MIKLGAGAGTSAALGFGCSIGCRVVCFLFEGAENARGDVMYGVLRGDVRCECDVGRRGRCL